MGKARALFLSVSFLIISLCVGVAIRAGVFVVTKVDIQINSQHNIQTYDLYRDRLSVELQPLLNKNIWQINLRQMISLIQEKGWVQQTKISRVIPNRINIVIDPRVFIGVYLSRSGDLLPFTEQSTVLEPVSPAWAPHVPVVDDPRFAKDSALRSRISKALSELNDTGRVSRENIDSLGVATDNSLWFQLRGSHSRVILGEENIAFRALRVSRVLEYLNSHDMKWSVIDADYSKKVLVRLRNEK